MNPTHPWCHEGWKERDGKGRTLQAALPLTRSWLLIPSPELSFDLKASASSPILKSLWFLDSLKRWGDQTNPGRAEDLLHHRGPGALVLLPSLEKKYDFMYIYIYKQSCSHWFACPIPLEGRGGWQHSHQGDQTAPTWEQLSCKALEYWGFIMEMLRAP